MYVIRPMVRGDFDTLVEFAFQSEGMSSLPKNKELLWKKIESSERAFAATLEKPVHELYLFALEETETNEVAGICGICSKTGIDAPLYVFEIEKTHKQTPKGIPDLKPIRALKAVSLIEAPTELCTLFLSRNHRKAGLGRLLSLSRLLFMAAFPNRFDTHVFAEMRGYMGKDELSPFYEGVMHCFVNLDRQKMVHQMEKGLGFLPYVLPDYPIYIELLPQEVQTCVGKVHPHTEPALRMLKEEGFQETGQVDLLDAGPWISAPIAEIRTFRESCTATLKTISSDVLKGEPFLVSNEKLAFRACMTPLQIQKEGTAILPALVAEMLQVQPGDLIRYIMPHKEVKPV